MADNSRPVAEPLQKSAQAAQAVRGAVKTGKAIAGAAKGAAAGGVWGAVAGFAWENRKFVGKVIIAATAVLMIPILILCMLPGIIFGGFGNSHSPADPDTPIMNSSAAIDSNLVEISTAVSCVLSEALTDTLTAIENDYAACTADGKEVINPYESSPNFNANLFVGQYCAAKNEDYAAVSVSDMESMLRSGKDKLYSYTKKEEERTVETVTTSVTVDLLYGSTATRKETYLASAGVVQGIRIKAQENMLEITLPCLLPKRKQRQSTEFLIDPLYFTLSQYSDNNELPKFRQCVVCFSHIYSEKFHNRRVRDYDNLELKQLLDVLSTFIMVDDTGLLVDAYNTTEIGEADCTRISVMAKEDFPKWLNEREKSLKTISDF